MPRWSTLTLWGVSLLIVLASEGSLFAQAPFSFLHLLYLPVLYAPPKFTPWGLLMLAILEWSLTHSPLGAALSLALVVYAGYYLIRDKINVRNVWFAFVLIPAIEAMRYICLDIFASLYRVPSPPRMLLTHIVVEAALGVIVLWLFFRYMGYHRIQRAAS